MKKIGVIKGYNTITFLVYGELKKLEENETEFEKWQDEQLKLLEKSKKENLAILKQSSGYIRSGIAKKVNLRNTPELIFEFDESLEYGTRIDEILKGITKDLKKGE